MARVCLPGRQLEKVLRAGDQWPIVDTSIEFTEDEDAPLGARFGSYAPARPWGLGLAVEFILSQTEEFIVGETPITGDGEKPTGDGCPICKSDQGEVEDFTLRCPNCTWWSAVLG